MVPSSLLALLALSPVEVVDSTGPAIPNARPVHANQESPAAPPADDVPLTDHRLGPLRSLGSYFPLPVPATREAWEERAALVRRQLQVALGLWPWPERTPLNAVVHGRIEQPGYTVEKVYFESMPGFFVTGNLYRPANAHGKVPGVLCPHGHWSNGRFLDAGVDAVRRDIVRGGERFENGGRSPLQARCATLARLGCVVFHYDMIGYADSQQISHAIAHGFARQRSEMSAADSYGLFSPRAEALLQNVPGLQTWNSVRALDFLESLEDVDASRIGVTGASGGGTQTFLLGALDPRPAVACPAVMVSTAMQGGCTCENACMLRVGTGNVEFAALFAPKPQVLTAANDWTVEMATKGFPELRGVYQLYEAADRVKLDALTHFGHNYNYVSRATMYAWFNEHLQLGHPTPILEEDYPRLDASALTVWNDQHPQPPGGVKLERELLRHWREDTERQLMHVRPVDGTSWVAFRQLLAPAWNVILDRVGLQSMSPWVAKDNTREDPVRFEIHVDAKTSYGSRTEGRLVDDAADVQLPLWMLAPSNANGRHFVLVHPRGKRATHGESGPSEWVDALLRRGFTVWSADLLLQGDFLNSALAAGAENLQMAEGCLTATRRVNNGREVAAYTLGYNRPLFVERTHDLCRVLAWVAGNAESPVSVVALDECAPLALAARFLTPEHVAQVISETAGFRFEEVARLDAPNFLPGGAKYGDLPGLIAATAPAPTLLLGEDESGMELAVAATAATGKPDTDLRFADTISPSELLDGWVR